MNTIPKVVFVGTYPPMQEGIATFNQDLVNAIQLLVQDNMQCAVCAINLADTNLYYADPKVEWEIDQQAKETYLQVADTINQDPSIQGIVVQHEYGIFGGTWGEYIVDFLQKINKKRIVVLHSVLATHEENPAMFRSVTESIIQNSDTLVVLSLNSQHVLTHNYPASVGKVVYIPHGVHPTPFIQPTKVKPRLGFVNKTILTTFGLLSRGKGIEYVLNALPAVIEKHPNVMYQILGQTHPMIRKKEGEKYRLQLHELIRELGIRQHVYMLDKYLSLEEILRYLRGTDIYIATSLNPNQSVSGTLSYAASTGRAIVSTEFTQAKEIIKPGIGLLVKMKDSHAYSEAINSLLADPKRLSRVNRLTYNNTRSMLWTNVALQYIELLDPRWVLPPISLKYLRRMTGKALYQFAKYDVPEVSSGYTVDDNARALMVTGHLSKFKLAKIYLDFLQKAQTPDGHFINYWTSSLQPVIDRTHESNQEPYARAVLALSELLTNTTLPSGLRRTATSLLNNALPHITKLTYLRPIATVLKALTTSTHNNTPIMEILADKLVAEFNSSGKPNWKWFEDRLTYNNGILVEAMFRIAKVTGKREYERVARQSMQFLLRQTFLGQVYVPIGQEKWYFAGGHRSYYDQQPEEPSAMVLALIAAYETTGKSQYLYFAKQAFSWYVGNNLEGVPLYNRKTGGVYDGLQPTGVNKNQGAESLVSYLIARTAIERYY